VKTDHNKILVVIPCYNEQDNILPLLDELKKVDIPNCSITPVVINDASSDDTRVRLLQSGVLFLENVVNLGIGGTVQLGFQYAFENKYDIAVQMDGDGQHPPSELHKILLPVINGDADVATGSRFLSITGFQSTFLRRVGIRFFYRLNKWLTGVSVKDSTSGFRAYNRKAFQFAVEYYPDEYPEPEMILYLAHKKIRIVEVPVNMHERLSGVSSINSFRSVYYMVKVSLNILFLHLKLRFNG
jgi:glycosyltransferase involved in cell wall biosynthesis